MSGQNLFDEHRIGVAEYDLLHTPTAIHIFDGLRPARKFNGGELLCLVKSPITMLISSELGSYHYHVASKHNETRHETSAKTLHRMQLMWRTHEPCLLKGEGML